MTFNEWFEATKKNIPHGGNENIAAKMAWDAALKECKEIIESMEGCTDVTYCKRDGLKQLEELR